jgi:hypothetical protein
MTKDQHIKYIPNFDPTDQRISAIARHEEFVNSPNAKAISITYVIEVLLYYTKKKT